MKHCAQWEFTFEDQVRVCDFDGTELSVVPEPPPSFKTVSFEPQVSGSFLGRLVKFRAALGVSTLAGVAVSAVLIGYYVSLSPREIDSSESSTQSDRVGIATPGQFSTSAQVEKQVDRPRIVSTQRKIRADE